MHVPAIFKTLLKEMATLKEGFCMCRKSGYNSRISRIPNLQDFSSSNSSILCVYFQGYVKILEVKSKPGVLSY